MSVGKEFTVNTLMFSAAMMLAIWVPALWNLSSIILLGVSGMAILLAVAPKTGHLKPFLVGALTAVGMVLTMTSAIIGTVFIYNI
jgi:hypothetical protein